MRWKDSLIQSHSFNNPLLNARFFLGTVLGTGVSEISQEEFLFGKGQCEKRTLPNTECEQHEQE